MLFNAMLNIVIGNLLITTERKIYDYYYSRYGKQHAVYFDIKEPGRSLLFSDDSLRAGFFYNYQSFTLEGTDQTYLFGSFDAEAIDISRLSLIAGKWPEKKNEIAVEKMTVDKRFPEGTTIGSELNFTDDSGNRQAYILVGIVDDYRGMWNYSDYAPITSGINDYPAVVCAFEPDSEPVINAFVHFNDLKNNLYGTVSSYYINNIGNQLGSMTIAYNNKVYDTAKLRVFDFYDTFKKIILAITTLSEGLIFFAFSLLIIQDYKKSISKYRLLGATRSFILCQLNCEIFSVYLATSGLCILLQFILGKEFSVLWLAVDLVILAVIVNLGVLRFINQAETRILSHKDHENIAYKRSLPDLIYAIFGKRNKSRIYPSIAILSVIIATFVISIFYGAEFSSVLNEGSCDFQIEVMGNHTWVFANKLIYAPEKYVSISYKEILPLYDLKGIDHIKAQYVPSGGLLIDRSDPYWAMLDVSMMMEDTISNADLINNMPDDIEGTVLDYSFYVIDDKLKDQIMRAFPDFPYDEMIKNSSVVLLSCPRSTVNNVLKNESLREGAVLRLGELDYINPVSKSVLFTVYSDLEYSETDLVIEKAYDYDRFIDILPLENDVGIIINAETLEDLSLFPTCSLLQIYLDEDISEADYQAVESYASDLMKYSVNAWFYSKKDEMAQKSELLRVINMALLIILCSYGLYSILSIYLIMSLFMSSRSRSTGILRSLGLNRKYLEQSLFNEVFRYTCYIVIISWCLILFIFHRIWLLPNLFTPRYMLTVYVTLGIDVCLLIAVPVAISTILSRRIYGSDLSDVINHSE